MDIRKTILLLVMTWFLAACSGDPFPEDESSDSGEDGSLVDEGDETNVSYLPLMTLDVYDDWSGLGEDDLFRTYTRTPSISHFTINPVNATTLEPITSATADDFSILEDGIPVNPNVSFPMLQRIVGNQVVLRTAIVINTSDAMAGYGVNQSALIDAIKDYVDAAKASDNYFIRNQEFTVWAVDGITVEETSNATADAADVKAALDTLNTNWTDGVYRLSGGNHVYDGVIEAIGRFSASTEFDVALDYRDSNTGDDNDLFDYVTPDYIKATTVLVFSVGTGSPNKSGEEDFTKALESQSTIVYSTNSEPSGAQTETQSLRKPLIYAVPEGQPQDSILSGLSHSVIEFSGTTYSFSDEIIDAQIDAIEEKNALTNQHVLRWANTVRLGDGHELKVKTRTAEDAYGYDLTVEYDLGLGFTNPMPDPQVEITGANNEYIATNNITTPVPAYDSATTYANLISTFYPATRWTNQEFTSSDYTWSFIPAGSMVENSDGSISIASGATFPIELTLTNNNITHDGVTISDDFVLTIQETNQ